MAETPRLFSVPLLAGEDDIENVIGAFIRGPGREHSQPAFEVAHLAARGSLPKHGAIKKAFVPPGDAGQNKRFDV